MYVSSWLLCWHEPKYLQDSLHHVLSGPDQDHIFRQDFIHCSGSWQLWWAAVSAITKTPRTLVGKRTKKQFKMCSDWWRPRLQPFSQKTSHANCCTTLTNRPSRGRRGRFVRVVQQLACEVFERPAVEGRRCRTIAMVDRSCGPSGTATTSAQTELAVNLTDVAHTFQPRATICCEAGPWSIAWANQRLPWDSLGYPKSYSDSK